MSPEAADRASDARRRLTAGLLLLVFAGLVAAVWAVWKPRAGTAPSPRPEASPDPRLLYEGPLQNVHPDVRYVGDSACAGCHAAKAESYARHPMGRSLAPVRDVVESVPDRPWPQPPLPRLRFALPRR